MFGAPVPIGRTAVTTTAAPTTTPGPTTTTYGRTTGVDGCPQVDVGAMPLAYTLPTGVFWSVNINQFNVGGIAISWSVIGTLPPGLTLNTSTGIISGVPTTSGTYNTSVVGSNNCADSGSYQSLPVDFEII